MRILTLLILAVSLLIVPPRGGFAHAYLSSALPPAGSTVTQAPSDVAIAFTGAIEPQFSSIEVTNASGQRMDDLKPHLIGGDATRLAVGVHGLPRLARDLGRYP
jgi:methionine-rich copper-binding protein CopC